MTKAMQPRQPRVPARRRQKNSPYLWPLPNPLRGRNYYEIAAAFVQPYPIWTTLNNTDIDTWCQAQGIYTIPGTDEAQGDARRVLPINRKTFLHKLNNAATHPHMYDLGSVTFYVKDIGHGWKEVQPPQETLVDQDIFSRLARIMEHLKRQAEYHLQAVDWMQQPPYELLFAEEAYNDIDGMQKEFYLKVEHYTTKYRRMMSRIQPMRVADRQQPQLPFHGTEAQDA